MCSNGQGDTGGGISRSGLIAALLDTYAGEGTPETWLDDIVELSETVTRLQAMQELRLATLAEANAPIEGQVRVCSPLADELAPMLAISPGSADTRLQRARKMCAVSPGVWGALHDGILPSIAHAAKYLEGLGPVNDPEVIADIEQHVLPQVQGRTPDEVKKLVEYAVARYDTADETQRCREAREKRSVRVFHHKHGVSSVYFTMRSEHAQWTYDFLHKTARRLLADPAAADALDEETVQQLMSDLAVQIFLDAANRWPGTTPAPGPRNGPDVPGMNDVPDETVEEHMAAAGDHLARQAGIVLDADTATGKADNPGDIPGYGPVPGPIARDIARNCKTWRAWLRDPATKEFVGLGRKQYPPSLLLNDYLNARDTRCRFPGCTRPAAKCDKDHVITWANGGTTDPDNMQSLCRRHHQEKTSGHWTAVMNDAAEVLWTSPHGKQYRTRPDTPLNAAPHEPRPPGEPPPF